MKRASKEGKMPKKSLAVEVNPNVLKWAVGSSGWNTSDITKKLKLGPAIFGSWLEGETKPTLKQLENLAKTVKRPLAVFFLPEPPKEKPLPRDYRMLPNKEGKFDKKTILAIRRARRLQKIGKELADNLNANPVKTLSPVRSSENPAKKAQEYRKEFNLDENVQKKFATPYEIFYFLRDVIEDKNIIVFQIPMPVEDARGFALVDDYPAIIVVNSKDSIEARIFTLMHEFGHVLLNESGISMPENTLFIKNAENIEKWCNDFSSAFLLPETIANEAFTHNKSVLTETTTLNKLSRTYKVSKTMLLYNMLKMGFISKSHYEEIIKRFSKPSEKGKKKGFRTSADKQCLNEKGQRFVSLVANNMEKGLITHSEALDYLSIKAKNLDKVVGRAKK